MRVLKMAGKVMLWVVQLLAAAAFVAIGIAKFASPEWAHKFAGWGYPDGFYLIIGALEAAAGVLQLVPRLASYAGMLLGAIMIGAAATHALHHEAARIPGPLMWLAVVSVIGLGRRRNAWRPGVRPLPSPVSQV